ncbi:MULTISPECIES: putative bifunctional diguanylate cyclase/phosphodiesterase [unclassified Aureimonas]|uniref:putative bifunctional diguanylate cyclase/phosphodiesterase n=1 Tax=unclassified Aureimonas TaxID=2615206 RepID=UPI00138F1388|nr:MULTISPECIES: EAL domain-containing protein [unclassified Aureimonas]
MPEMQLAQFHAVTKQAALFYATFWLNTSSIAYSFYGVAPDWLVLPPICVLTPVCLLRTLHYRRRQSDAIEIEEAVRRLRVLTRFVHHIMTAVAIWCITLSQFGDQTTDLKILCFVILQALCNTFGLMHIPATALRAAVPFSLVGLYFLLFKGPDTQLASLTFLVMSNVAVTLSIIYYDVLLSRVLQHHQLKRLGDENLRLANTDLLTGLPNRRNFLQKLEAELAAPGAALDRMHLVLIDLDGFKPVNDTYGHLAGDKVLKEVGRRLSAFQERCEVARLGGDEFGIVLYGDRPAALRQAEEIARSLRQTYMLAQGCVNVGATLGIANAGEAKGEMLELMENADYALYEGKAAGRNQTVTFDLGHETALHHRNRMEQTLRDADLEAELSLQFQPIVCAASGQPVMFEALARWQSPLLGAVPPQNFIAMAEATDLIGHLTKILFAKALSAATLWPSGIGLSFNLSAQDLVNSETTAMVSQAIEAAGIEPGRITFELTEGGLIRDFAVAQATLQALKGLGVSLAIDDFGTGYSSLTYVHRLPIDKLKIDRSFVTELEESTACRDIVTSIIGLCRSQGLECVAEGVETEGQGQLLRSLGCDLLQGYGPGRPMWEKDIAGFIAAAEGERAASARQEPPTATAADRSAASAALEWNFA